MNMMHPFVDHLSKNESKQRVQSNILFQKDDTQRLALQKNNVIYPFIQIIFS